ncbi:unnamed protein product [Eretmochelys imbricata]
MPVTLLKFPPLPQGRGASCKGVSSFSALLRDGQVPCLYPCYLQGSCAMSGFLSNPAVICTSRCFEDGTSAKDSGAPVWERPVPSKHGTAGPCWRGQQGG